MVGPLLGLIVGAGVGFLVGLADGKGVKTVASLEDGCTFIDMLHATYRGKDFQLIIEEYLSGRELPLLRPDH